MEEKQKLKEALMQSADLIQNSSYDEVRQVIDKALKLALDAKEKGTALSIGLLGNAADIYPKLLKENIIPVQEAGHLNFVENPKEIFNNFSALFVNGHTEAQMIPHITFKDKTIVFGADLLPSTGHIPLPYVMGYDTRPLLTLPEKKSFLDKAADEEIYLFMQHDAHNEVITVKHTEKGVRHDQTYTFNELFN